MAKRLRKVLLRTAAETDNAASFVNESGDDLHIRKIVMDTAQATVANGDEYSASIDEVPTTQAGTNDSRAHVLHCASQAEGTVGNFSPNARAQISFERGQLVLEPDEALFLNIAVTGTGTGSTRCNIWYE